MDSYWGGVKSCQKFYEVSRFDELGIKGMLLNNIKGNAFSYELQNGMFICIVVS